MKMLKSPVIAASVTLSLTTCFEDNTTNAVPNGEAPISAESPTGNEFFGVEIPGSEIPVNQFPGNEAPYNQNPINGSLSNENPENQLPDSGLSSTSSELPGDELGGNDIFSSSSAIPGNPPNPNPGNRNHLFTTVNGKQDTAKAAIYAKDDLNIKGASYMYR